MTATQIHGMRVRGSQIFADQVMAESACIDRWAILSAAYCLCYEHFSVRVTKDTPLFRATRNGKQGIVTAAVRIVVTLER